MKTTFLIFITLSTIFSNKLLAQKDLLIGSWQSSNGTITNISDEYISMGGETYSYSVSDNIITVYDTNNNTLFYTYKISGNTLYLTVENVGTYELKKVSNTQSTNNNQNINNKDAGRLYGSFCSYSSSGYSGSSSYSTTETVYFDGRGHYRYGSQSSYSGNGDAYSGGGGGYSGTYKVVGNEGVILTSTDGSEYRVAIFFVQDSGEITELKYDGTVYAKSLCD